MSLGGISGYGQPGNISIPEDYSYTPYLPYAQYGPYQSIMSQMGNYGTGAGNVYGGAGGGGATGGYNPDLYKRVAAAAPLAPAVIDSTTRGGGDRSESTYGSGAGLAQFGGSGFSPGVSPYANKLAAFLGNLGFTGISDAIAKNVNTNYGNEGKNAPPTVVGNIDYSNEGRNYPAPAPTPTPAVIDGGFNPISGYSVGPAVSTPVSTPAVIDGGFNPISGYSVGPAVSAPTPAVNVGGGEFGSWGGEGREGRTYGGNEGGGGWGGEGREGRGYSGGEGGGDGGGDGGGGGGDYKGGYIKASMLYGPDPAGPDEGYRALKSGEYVINDKSVKKYGIDLMNAINSGKISKGKLRGLLEM